MHSRITHVPGEVRVVFELSCLYSSDLRLVVCIIAFHRVSLLESFKGKKNTLGLSSRIDGLTLLYDQKAVDKPSNLTIFVGTYRPSAKRSD